MEEWNRVTIQDVTTVLGDGLHGTPKYTDDGEYAFINGNNLINGKIVIKKDTKRVDATQFEKYRKPLDDRTILVSINGTLGNVALYNGEKIVLGKSACYFNVKKEYDKEFIKYIVSSKKFKNHLENSATGTTIKNISLKQMREYEFDIPSYELQCKISGILKNIDDKIENNEAINRNLSEQLDLAWIDIFTDIEQDIELGDVVQTTSGGTPSRKKDGFYDNSSIFWVKSKELQGTFIIDTEEKITDIAVEKSSAKILPAYSVLIAMYGATVGEYGVISKKMACNQAVCALLENGQYPYSYLYALAGHSKNKLRNMAVGSAQQNISQVLIKQLKIHSDLEAIKKYDSIAKPILIMIENNIKESLELEKLRDALLPKLMSGELDVSQIEK